MTEWVRFIYSRQGQSRVARSGFHPMDFESAVTDARQLAVAVGPIDPRLPAYQPIDKVEGVIKSVGADALNHLMTLWAEQMLALYPGLQVEIEGNGTSTAPPAMIAGRSNFAPRSRPWSDVEVKAFKDKYGYEPTALRVAIDQLAVFVHKDNPIAKRGLTLPQLDAIFSSTRRLGHPKNITTWGDLGLQEAWSDQAIHLYGRNSASGTYGFFKRRALGGGDFKPTVREQPGSSSIVAKVAQDRFGIGYNGVGYSTEDVAVVPIVSDQGERIMPTAQNVDVYPLGRYLLLYVNHKPGSTLGPLRREFIKLVFSRQGQYTVVRDGYLPMDAHVAETDAKKVGIVLR